MLKKDLTGPAPSIFAASYNDLGTCYNADKKNNIEEPNCHTESILIVVSAILGFVKKPILPIPNLFNR